MNNGAGSQGLLAYLIMKNSSHPENVATDALEYILQQWPVARAAFARLCRTFEGGLPDPKLDPMDFYSQDILSGGSRPDLAGIDRTGQRRVLIEVKFWARLTDAQPVAYLHALEVPGLLLFIAPSTRVESLSLWRELQEKEPSIPDAPSHWQAAAVLNRTLAVVSWKTVLQKLEKAIKDSRAMSDNDKNSALGDLSQLQGLCVRMDDDAFVPVQTDDLLPAVARRHLSFLGLVDKMRERLSHNTSALGSRMTLGNLTTALTWYGFSFTVASVSNPVDYWFSFNLTRWARMRNSPSLATPFWVAITCQDKPQAIYIENKLKTELKRKEPERFQTSRVLRNEVGVAIYMSTGVDDEDIVIREMEDQILEIVHVLDF